MTDPLLPVISKVKGATLTFGGTAPDYADGVDFACDMRAIKVTPSTDVADPIELACGTEIAGEITETYTINGSAIQLFNDPTRLQAYAELHKNETVHWRLRLNQDGAPLMEGDVTMVRLEWGGDAGPNPGDLAWEFEGIGDYTVTYDPPDAPLAEAEAVEVPA